MSRPSLQRGLTPLETLLMDAVWRLAGPSASARRGDPGGGPGGGEPGGATVRQVQEALQATRPLAYNTVLTVMRILRDKGYLESGRAGRADVYRPRISREETARGRLGELLQRFFAGSPAELVSQLLDSQPMDPDQLKAIRREVDRRLDEKRKGRP